MTLENFIQRIIVGFFLGCSMSCNPMDTPPGMSDVDSIDCDEYLESEYPAITHEGKGTVAAYLNGELWIPKTDTYYGVPPEEWDIDPRAIQVQYWGDTSITNNPSIFIRFDKRYSNECDTVSEFISLNAINVELNKKLPTMSPIVFHRHWWFDQDRNWENYIIIEHLDTIAKTVSGRFAFRGLNSDPDTVLCTDGLFDVEYEPYK